LINFISKYRNAFASLLSSICLVHCVGIPLLAAMPFIGVQFFQGIPHFEPLHEFLTFFAVAFSLVVIVYEIMMFNSLYEKTRQRLIYTLMSLSCVMILIGYFNHIEWLSAVSSLTLAVSHILNHSFCITEPTCEDCFHGIRFYKNSDENITHTPEQIQNLKEVKNQLSPATKRLQEGFRLHHLIWGFVGVTTPLLFTFACIYIHPFLMPVVGTLMVIGYGTYALTSKEPSNESS
jgi:hypothetical protein